MSTCGNASPRTVTATSSGYEDLGRTFDKRAKRLAAIGLAFNDSGELIVVDRALAEIEFEALLSDFDEEERP